MPISPNLMKSTDRLRILLAEKSSFSQTGIDALAKLGALDALDLSQEALASRIGEYDVLVLRLGLRVSDAVLRAGKALKAVVTPTTGTDHIDLDVLRERGITLFCLKGERSFLDRVYATAEHTFGLLLAIVRKTPFAFDSVKSYQWRRDIYRGRELDGKTLGIVGCGRLGTMVVRYARAFGMRVLVFDPYQTNLPAEIDRVSTLDELLEESDIVSLHVPLNDETTGMIGEEAFSKMKPGGYLVNTSRGAVVDENALIAALESGRLSGAAMDVVCDEHTIETERSHPLIDYAKTHENLIITPHIAGATVESVEKADLFVIQKLARWLEKNHFPVSGN